jgi:hypothetical protein
MREVERARARHDRRQRVVAQPERPAERPERVGAVGMDEAGDPPIVRRRAQRPGPDEDDVGEGPQQAHHESVRLEEAADLAAASRLRGVVGDDAVDGGDEIGDDGGAVVTEGNTERPTVSGLERGR